MNYNYIAPYYDTLSRLCFLNRQQKAHQIILQHLKPNDKILWLGGGSGWFLEEINRLNIPIEIDYVELSFVMINTAKSRNYTTLKINFYQEDMLKFETNKTYDVIITAFIFDHFTVSECQVIFDKFNQNLKLKGKWIYIDFIEEQNFVQRILTQSMVLFFKLIANIKTNKFPEIDYLFSNFDLLEDKFYFGNYIVSRIYKK